MTSVYQIKEEDYTFCVSWRDRYSNLSSFDNKLLSEWKNALRNGFFRYELNIQGSSVLPGEWNFFSELNPDRGEQRRKPFEFYSLNEPFNPSLFNFTRIKNEELLFKLQFPKREEQCQDQDVIAINISPISEGHSLLIPCISKMYPQVLTQHSIELGLRLILMSSTPAFRVAFNSLCGFASVNHLHLHCLYIDNPMKLESIGLQTLQGPCMQISNYPGKGFAFHCQPKCDEDIKTLAMNVFKLTSFLQCRNEAHNVVMTRSKLTEDEEVLSCIRVYVWARKSNKGAKEVTGFNLAALELFGYIICKNVDTFKHTDERSIAKILEEATLESFERNYKPVMQLFQG